MDLNLFSLEVFLKVIETGSFSRAAQELCLSQPAVSIQVKALEKRLGVPLLHRSRSRVVPTPAGELLERHARDLLHVARELCEALCPFRSGQPGDEFRVGLQGATACALLPLLRTMQDRMPQLRMQVLKEPDPNRLVALLLEGRLCCAVLGRPLHRRSVRVELLREEELWFIAPRGHPLAGRTVPLSEILEHELLLREEEVEVVRAALGARGVRQPPRLRALPHEEEVLAGVRDGRGVGLLPRSCVGERMAEASLQQVVPREGSLYRPLYLAYAEARACCSDFRLRLQALRDSLGGTRDDASDAL